MHFVLLISVRLLLHRSAGVSSSLMAPPRLWLSSSSSVITSSSSSIRSFSSSTSVFTWGGGRKGELGHSKAVDLTKPRKVDGLENANIRKAVVGEHRSAFVSESGELFICGRGFRQGPMMMKRQADVLVSPPRVRTN